MESKEFNNVFKFSLRQGNVLLCEKIFDADKFNPFTRYSINIRHLLPKIVTKLQKVLSRRSYDVLFDVGKKHNYDLYKYNQKIINSYPNSIRNELRYDPKPIIQEVECEINNNIEIKTIRGVECEIGLYINDNKIVERSFYVDGFNPVARWSVDLIDAVVESTDLISNHIKKADVRNMWDDYSLIHNRGLSISQIRELTPMRREELLRKINRN